MRSTLDLSPVALVDVSTDGEGALGLMRSAGPSPRVALVAADGGAFALAPGAYSFELEMRGDTRVAPRLSYAVSGGEDREATLDRQSAFCWRAELEFARTVVGLTLALDG